MDNSMNLWLQISVDLRIVIIIIKSLINSAALKTQTRCRHMSFSAAEQVPSGVQKLPSTVTKDADRFVGCSRSLDRRQQNSCDRCHVGD